MRIILFVLLFFLPCMASATTEPPQVYGPGQREWRMEQAHRARMARRALRHAPTRDGYYLKWRGVWLRLELISQPRRRL